MVSSDPKWEINSTCWAHKFFTLFYCRIMGPETLPCAGSDYNSRLQDEEYDAYTNDPDGSLCEEGNDGRPVLQLQVPVVDY